MSRWSKEREVLCRMLVAHFGAGAAFPVQEVLAELDAVRAELAKERVDHNMTSTLLAHTTIERDEVLKAAKAYYSAQNDRLGGYEDAASQLYDAIRAAEGKP